MCNDPPGEIEPGALSAPTEGLPEVLLKPGQVLGERYQNCVVTARLPSLSTRKIVAALRQAGFENAPRLVIILHSKDLPIGTLRAIIQQAGLTTDELLGPLG